MGKRYHAIQHRVNFILRWRCKTIAAAEKEKAEEIGKLSRTLTNKRVRRETD
jgi:hypothetical protein